MKIRFALLSVLLPSVIASAQQGDARPFAMGFTTTSSDVTPESFEATYAFIEENATIVAHHLDEGVPWPEAFEGKPFPAKVEENLAYRASKRSGKLKVYVAAARLTSMGGEGLCGYWGEDSNMERPGEWKDRGLDSPEVARAYTSYCRTLIQRLKPDYFAYAIEVNLSIKSHETWSKLVGLSKEVYTALKAENASLPIFVTIQIDEFWKNEGEQRAWLQEILPYTDMIAISSYPYVSGIADPGTIPAGYFSEVAKLAPEKPFAVAETGFLAEDWNPPGARIPGTEEAQQQYLERVLGECAGLHAAFAIWFVPRDYDATVAALKQFGAPAEVVQLFEVWKDNGLVDQDGKERKSFQTWKTWLERQRR